MKPTITTTNLQTYLGHLMATLQPMNTVTFGCSPQGKHTPLVNPLELDGRPRFELAICLDQLGTRPQADRMAFAQKVTAHADKVVFIDRLLSLAGDAAEPTGPMFLREPERLCFRMHAKGQAVRYYTSIDHLLDIKWYLGVGFKVNKYTTMVYSNWTATIVEKKEPK